MNTEQKQENVQDELTKARAKIAAVEKVMAGDLMGEEPRSQEEIYNALHAAIYSDQWEQPGQDELRAQLAAKDASYAMNNPLQAADALRDVLKAARDAFIQYEMHVDEEAPWSHIKLRERIDNALANYDRTKKEKTPPIFTDGEISDAAAGWCEAFGSPAEAKPVAPAPQAVAQATLSVNEEMLCGLLQWFIGQCQGESGAGENYWEQFTQYRLAQSAVESMRGKADAKPVAADWMRELAHDFARWFDNEGVGNCFDECLAIVKQHAPEPAQAVSADWMMALDRELSGRWMQAILDGKKIQEGETLAIIAKHCPHAPAQDSRDSAITAQELESWLMERHEFHAANDVSHWLRKFQAERERAAMAAEAKKINLP